MINLRTHAASAASLLGLLAASALTGCAGANYEAETPTSYVAEVQPVGPARGYPGDDVPGSAGAAGGVVMQRSNTDVAIGADAAASYADTDPSAVTEFREPLAPYGTWVEDSTYGTVWVPNATVVGADFTPYATAGHWTYDDEWVWVSDYSWGWAPFHYGRWTYIGGRGWGWIPGRVYRGAWVSWRVGPAGYGYVGWAPLAPSWYWYNGYAYGLYSIPPSPYVFCSTRNVFSPGVGGHIVRGPEVAQIGAGTTPHTPATPSVDRVKATPSVAGDGGSAIARASSGPKPEALGISNSDVVRTPKNNAGLSQAQAYATPATAVARGAAPPGSVSASYMNGRNGITGASVATAPRFTPTTDLTRSATAPVAYEGGSRPSADPNYRAASTSPRYLGVEPRTSSSFAASAAAQSRYASPNDRAPVHASSVAPYAPRPMQPAAPPTQGSFSSAPTYSRPSPSYAPTPSYSRPSAPTFSQPSYSRPSAPTFSQPSYSRPSSPSVSAPSVARPSAPSVSRPASPSVSRPSMSRKR